MILLVEYCAVLVFIFYTAVIILPLIVRTEFWNGEKINLKPLNYFFSSIK